jgi:signal transduction histidine kinase
MKPEQDLTLPGLVHDLNNVFQALVDAADLLASQPECEKVSASILRSVERGRHITASIANGGASVTFEKVLAGAIAFVEDSAPGGKRTDIRFVCEVDSSIELRRGWAWERVLINLFLNSRRAMPDGGAIHIRARRKGRHIEISVADDGSGIDPAILDTIFEPRVSGHGSSGLGLHIVRTIVSQDGGSVRAVRLEKGTQFVMTLPASAAVEPQSRMARAGD